MLSTSNVTVSTLQTVALIALLSAAVAQGARPVPQNGIVTPDVSTFRLKQAFSTLQSTYRDSGGAAFSMAEHGAAPLGQVYTVGFLITSPWTYPFEGVPVSGGAVVTSPLITLTGAFNSPSGSGFAFPSISTSRYLASFGANLIITPAGSN